MTPEQQKAINELRDAGYMVIIFSPDELWPNFDHEDAEHFEDAIYERGKELLSYK